MAGRESRRSMSNGTVTAVVAKGVIVSGISAWPNLGSLPVATLSYPGDTVVLSAVDHARALASGAVVNPNSVIVPVGNSGAFQIVPVT